MSIWVEDEPVLHQDPTCKTCSAPVCPREWGPVHLGDAASVWSPQISLTFSHLDSIRHLVEFYWIGNLISGLFLENSSQVVTEFSLSTLAPSPTDTVGSVQWEEISSWILKRKLACSWGKIRPHTHFSLRNHGGLDLSFWLHLPVVL